MSLRIFSASFIFLLLLGAVFTCSLSFAPCVAGLAQSGYGVGVAFPHLTFNQPVGIYSPGDGTNRLFVVEQPGVIRVFENSENVAVPQVFLDIGDHVLFGGEQGLLGLAFHPNYKVNGYFYVDYVADNPLRTVIARYQVITDNPNQADPNSELVILTVEQPFPNHKGGQLAFGKDGYLYIGLGDGGSGGDPLGNGQNRSTLLGKILRVDVNSPSAGRNYGIPSDNPFVGNSFDYREEIYAYGLRNPWRFSFDPANGKLWVGDVGQDRMEEIDVVEKGKNYGWNIMEGTLCYDPASGCNQTGLEIPVWTYSHNEGNAVVGGYVYHGSMLPELSGSYVYGDYGSGKIWALQYNGTGTPSNTLLVSSNLTISSFGLDNLSELYICAFDGKIYRLNNVIPEFPSAVPFLLLILAVLLVSLIVRKRKIKNNFLGRNQMCKNGDGQLRPDQRSE
jgi:glucose/arabinose dehydrogenase